MPLTPLHLGPGWLLGIFGLRFLNLWGILIGSVIMDLEPVVLLLINPCYLCPHHGFFHSILGAILGSFLLALILFAFRKKLEKVLLKIKIKQNFSFKSLYFSSLLGWLLHIFLDNLTHYDVFLFWPTKIKIFYFGPRLYWPLSFGLFLMLLAAFIISFKYVRHKVYSSKS